MGLWETPSLVFMENSMSTFTFSYLSLTHTFHVFCGLLFIFLFFFHTSFSYFGGDSPPGQEPEHSSEKTFVPGPERRSCSSPHNERCVPWASTAEIRDRRWDVLSVSDGPFVSAQRFVVRLVLIINWPHHLSSVILASLVYCYCFC